MEVQIQKIALLSALFFASFIALAEQAVPRKYYGAKLEPVAHVLHGAGQGNVADVLAYRETVKTNYPVLLMDYCAICNASSNYVEQLRIKLNQLNTYTAVQLGLSMGRDGKPELRYEQEVAEGTYDVQLAELFNHLKTLDVPFYIRIGYECNGSWNGYASESYKKAFIRVTQLIRTSGLNAATVWCIFPEPLAKVMPFYPGDEWVDWWAFDPFTVKNMEAARPFIAEADRHHKPVMIGESTPRNIGVLEGDKSWDAWFVHYFRMLHENPGIKAFCYINWDWSKYPQWRTWGDARLQKNEVVAERYRKELANPLYLHGTTAEAMLSACAGQGSQLIANLASGKPQTIVTYGTSLTFGGAWVGQMKEALNQKYKGLITLHNSGKCSMWSKWGVENLDALVIQKKPDTVIIEFAVNDAFLAYKTSVAEARTNLLNMVERIQAAKPDTEIILMTMNPPIGIHLDRRPKIIDYVQMYRDVAKERRVCLIDNYPNWERIVREDPERYSKYVPDGIHPGAEGYRNVVTPVILRSLGLERR